MTPDPEQLGVSRETFERLKIYVDLIRKWSPKINLVSKNSLDDIWHRHIQDSLEIVAEADEYWDGDWLDFGSGGGLPGIVAAIISAEHTAGWMTRLVESDVRKSAFLRTVGRECDLNIEVQTARIETLVPQNARIISARALASLDKLLEFSDRHLHSEGQALFPKGISWKKELSEAQRRWRFDHEVAHSQTEPGSVILKIKGISRA
ncbi:MAG: 16S rRNA (guanine(527)-N(7))-methyltransferase RsmG [Rhodobacteraceae bacterium]|nr:16S rRNA (guanine(527)-N(7))-methyltransferase RsmG [Paracoccaceae bacterium]